MDRDLKVMKLLDYATRLQYTPLKSFYETDVSKRLNAVYDAIEQELGIKTVVDCPFSGTDVSERLAGRIDFQEPDPTR